MISDNSKILVIDDETSITDFIQMGLEAEGFEVLCANDGVSGIRLARQMLPDLIILDIMLPNMNGFDACQEIRKFTKCPIIMLTARSEIEDRIRGLNFGADDYMGKPFSFQELLARINARLRVFLPEGSDIDEIGPFTIDDARHQITFKGTVLKLSPTEFSLLKYLLKNRGQVISKQLILEKIWGYDFDGEANIVEVYIRYLRHKIDDQDFQIIQTVRGAGYKLVIDND